MASGVVGRRLAREMTKAGRGYAWPVPWYVITHPRGNVLIDGGMSSRCASDARGHLGDSVDEVMPAMALEEACVASLERSGIEPASIRYVLQSHLHWDHTGAVAAIDSFPNATVLVTREEHEFALAPDWPFAAGYAAADFAGGHVPWTLLEESDDGFDLLGDSTVRIWRTPGHSVGHVSFEVNLDSSGSFLLLGDAANTLDHWNRFELASFMTSGLEATRSIERLRQLADQRQATVVCGHDPENWSAFRRAPQCYG